MSFCFPASREQSTKLEVVDCTLELSFHSSSDYFQSRNYLFGFVRRPTFSLNGNINNYWSSLKIIVDSSFGSFLLVTNSLTTKTMYERDKDLYVLV